jgi:transcription elongation factor GreA
MRLLKQNSSIVAISNAPASSSKSLTRAVLKTFENVEYHLATELQSVNDARIVELEDKLARAEIIDISKLSGETITFGATVTLIDENTDNRSVWQIVGEPEADPKKRKISFASPLARALIGKKKGSEIEVAAPGGAKEYKVLTVEWR